MHNLTSDFIFNISFIDRGGRGDRGRGRYDNDRQNNGKKIYSNSINKMLEIRLKLILTGCLSFCTLLLLAWPVFPYLTGLFCISIKVVMKDVTVMAVMVAIEEAVAVDEMVIMAAIAMTGVNNNTQKKNSKQPIQVRFLITLYCTLSQIFSFILLPIIKLLTS